MPKVTYLANQLYASDTINVSCSEGNYTLNARIPLELSNESIFALLSESQVFLDTVSANSISIEGYTEPDAETFNKKKVINLIKSIEESVTFESLYTAIDFKVRDKLSTLIADEMAKQILPKIFGENKPPESTVEKTPESISPQNVSALAPEIIPGDETPVEVTSSTGTTTKKTAK